MGRIVSAVAVAAAASLMAAWAILSGPPSGPDPADRALGAPQASEEAGDRAVRWVLVPEASEARYEVREQLAELPLPTNAVGRTKAITGTIALGPDGTILPEASKFSVDLGTLTSDDRRRDRFLRERTLQTNRFPLAEFVPRTAQGLPAPLPTSGEAAF